jgi:hypothetical protein
MDALIAKIQEAEIMLATIKTDLLKADLKQKIFSKTLPAVAAVNAIESEAIKSDMPKLSKDGAFEKKFSKRYDPDTFVDEIYKLSKERTFTDGKTKKALCGLPRTCWPLRENGEPYEKLQHLCQDYQLVCVRDDPEKPTVFIIFE